MRIARLLAATAMLQLSVAASAASDTPFLDFPYVDSVSAAKAPAFAWLVKQADKSSIRFARAPDFRRITLASRADDQGQPITAIQLSPDGAHVAFMTGVPRAGEPFNPAGLVPAPEAKLWVISTALGAKPVDLGTATEPSFSPDGRTLLFKRGDDLWSFDTRVPRARPKLFAKGGGSWSQFVWTKAGDLVFVDDRRGYSFIGRLKPRARE